MQCSRNSFKNKLKYEVWAVASSVGMSWSGETMAFKVASETVE